MLGSWITSDKLGSGYDDEINIAHAMLVNWGDGNAIEADTLAMMVNVVGANDGGEFVVHCVSDLLADRTFSDVVGDKALGNLVARELFAERKVSSTISKVTIAITMDRIKG